MKFTAHFFLKKLDLTAAEGQNLGALSDDFPDLKVAIEETKEEADALGADVFELESDNGYKTTLGAQRRAMEALVQHASQLAFRAR